MTEHGKKAKIVGVAVFLFLMVASVGTWRIHVAHGQQTLPAPLGTLAPVSHQSGSPTGVWVCNSSSENTLNADDNSAAVYKCHNGSWVQINAVTQGATGPTGNTGLTGSAGATGAQGVTGSQGITGSAGVTGIQGVTGTAGSTGTVGATGSTGATGTAGTNGTNGTNGSNGATGVTGPTGVTGATGATGTNATSYLSGTSGTITGTLLAVGGTDTGTLTLTGASVGMPCTADTTDGTNPSSSVAITCRVTSTNTVTVILTAFAIATPASKAYNVRVFP